MAFGEIYGMVIYPSVLFRPGGNVNRWANSVEHEFTGYARQFAPRNKRGNKGGSLWPVDSLRASIGGSVRQVGPEQLETLIEVRVPYALAVLRGTTGPITSHSGRKMDVPDNAFWGTGPRRVVSGQRAQPFMKYAALATGRTHSSVAGWMPT